MQKILLINDDSHQTKVIVTSEEDIIKAAKYIADIIRDKYELRIIDCTLIKNYTYLEKDEQMFIRRECKNLLNDSRHKINKYIFDKLFNYLKKENTIDLYGFILFRLKEYISEIENAVDSSVNEFIIEREYNQLIDGLILYAELQVPLIDTINVLQINNKYIITDKSGEEIITLKKFDDVILDIILTLSPKKIIIFNPEDFKNKELLDTIKKVFSRKVLFINTGGNNELFNICTSKGDKE